MKKVLLIGNGAREHALAETILKSKDTNLYAFMSKKNPGIAKISSEYVIADLSDFDELKKFCEKVKPDIAMIGPEGPLDIGIVDFLETINIPAIGPKKEQARLETSKSFTRELMKKYNIEGNPLFRSFESSEGIWEFMGEIDEVVVKPDGLTGGKGVKVQGDHFDSKEQALAYCTEVLESHPSVIVEEKLEGEEFSLQCLTDGITVIDSPPVQDHKRAYNGDKGPNCYSFDTEILSENGWKTFNKLKRNEKVMTFDPKKKLLEFKKPRNIYWRKYNGKMIHFQHRDLDLLVTPSHRMLVKNRKTNRTRVSKAEDLVGENNVFLTGIWKGTSPKYYNIEGFDYKFNRKLKKQKILFIDWVRFMGLFLSEGYTCDTVKEHRIYICQTRKSRYFKDFEKILSKLPFKFSYDEKWSKFRINSVQLCKTLKKYGTSREKYIPDYIKNAKKAHIIEFLNAFCMGDGSVHNGRMRFHSGSKNLINDIQELILKIGKSGIITTDKRKKMLNPINKKYYKANNVYSIEIKLETFVGIRKKDIKVINYKDYIGCVTVQSGFVVVRRNNRVAISGNTGGMGSYSCENHLLPFLKKEDVDAAHRITEKVAKAIYKETGQYYVGIMYGGFIVTKNGVKLIEYNARFGDPEAMNVLPLLKTDCGKVCEAMVSQNLKNIKLEFEKKATVCKYAVPEGYPEDPVEGKKVELDKDAKANVYYASVNEKDGEIFMSSSRAIAFVGIAGSIEEAEKIAEDAVSNVKGPVFHRTDIGTQKLLQRRVDHMKELRNDE